MNTFFKILAAVGAGAAAVLIAMKLIEASRRSADDRRHIALFKKESAVAGRKSGRLGTVAQKLSDEIADFRSGDDEDACLFEDYRPEGEPVYDDSAYDDIFAEDSVEEAVEDIAGEIAEEVESVLEAVGEAAAEQDGISEDALEQLLDS